MAEPTIMGDGKKLDGGTSVLWGQSGALAAERSVETDIIVASNDRAEGEMNNETSRIHWRRLIGSNHSKDSGIYVESAIARVRYH